ncbi:MAG: histone deacetylase [Chloroflexota bacterium]
MKLFYSERRPLPLPEGHSFPAPKYTLLLERLQAAGLAPDGALCQAQPASREDLLRVHTADYIGRMLGGEMTDKEMRRIGFPWSPALVERVLRSVGATLGACQAALVEGVAANLGGGTHHAYPDHGEGYCVFNDVAVAARAMQAQGHARRVVVLDCDVHQGNGTAAIFAGDASVFTFSVHGEKNFPFHKERSSLDIALPDGSGDEAYLAAVEQGTRLALEQANADLAVYIAGADPYEGDRLGRMAVSKAGLGQRDRLALGMCRAAGLPTTIVMGGGYARRIEDMIDIQVETIRIAIELWRGGCLL